jgi:hypothetical protein
MNYQLEVCLVALALITGVTPSVAAHSQQVMQKGDQRRVASHQKRRIDARCRPG